MKLKLIKYSNPIHSETRFQTTALPSILNQMNFNLAQNRKEICHHEHWTWKEMEIYSSQCSCDFLLTFPAAKNPSFLKKKKCSFKDRAAVHKECTNGSEWKKKHRWSEKLATLGTYGAQLMTPFELLNTIELWCWRGFRRDLN